MYSCMQRQIRPDFEARCGWHDETSHCQVQDLQTLTIVVTSSNSVRLYSMCQSSIWISTVREIFDHPIGNMCTLIAFIWKAAGAVRCLRHQGGVHHQSDRCDRRLRANEWITTISEINLPLLVLIVLIVCRVYCHMWSLLSLGVICSKF
jgi:hypothetical protein